MPFDVIRGPGVPASHLPFSPALRAGGFVFLSGQASVNESGAIVSDTFEGEFRRSLENAKRILAAAGLTLDGVVYPHAVQQRFSDFHFDRAFPTLSALAKASQHMQHVALKYEIDLVAFAGGQ
jgi:2-iminobutanoate/2-iminopropanoate deaminase